jgi:hypothetical protein
MGLATITKSLPRGCSPRFSAEHLKSQIIVTARGRVIGSTIGWLSAATATLGFAGLAARRDGFTGNKIEER